ncbi:3155_t:CDS:2, partial [Diversispora eburnea]
ALRVRFQPASEGHVIPNEKVEEFPEQYVCPRINRNMLGNSEFKVGKISDFSDRKVQTFFHKLHLVTRNLPGISESRTGVAQPQSKLHILNEPYVSATPEFVINKETISMVIAEDKSLQNVSPRNDFGEMQIAGEILACGDENIRETGELSDQVLFAVRFIYVTFYKAEIPAKYWNELDVGLPKKYSVAIKRWPGENKKRSGLDLADPDGRKTVFCTDQNSSISFEVGESVRIA